MTALYASNEIVDVVEPEALGWWGRNRSGFGYNGSMENHTTELKNRLQLLQTGSPNAKAALIEHACERLRLLTHRMLKNYPRVGRWADTGDVLQAALIRLHRSLDSVQPDSAEQFYSLAATQIRRELLDLLKHHYGPEGRGANHQTDTGSLLKQNCISSEPSNLVEWEEFHQHVGCLPDIQRKVVELLWYEGLSQAEAADVLGISLATLKRRWAEARLRLANELQGWAPQ
ncbi:MAG: hypothetical protein RL240_249 [Planctomycetota bacterium]|jgi:RNA polymerase sigma-70 factor (ECF subfamily)